MLTEVHHQNWHMQGFTSDMQNGYQYWSFTDSVVKTNLNSTVIAQVHVPGGHLGDIDFHEGKLYSSFLGEPHGPVWDDWTSYKLYVFNADDLRLERIIDLPICDALRAEADLGTDPYGFHAIDGVTFGKDTKGETKLFLACALLTGEQYRNQLLLQFSLEGEFEEIHTIPIGNTVFGIQNLDYDETTGCFWFTTYGASEPYQPKQTLYCIEPDLKTVRACYRYSTPYGFECLGNGQFLASIQSGKNGSRDGYAYSCTEEDFKAECSEREITERVLKEKTV